ncbi:MAG: hypothetical protein WA751_05020 [Candidatus Dormiibacterota bacterium]
MPVLAAVSLSASAFVVAGATLAMPAAASTSYQALVAGSDATANQAAVKVLNLPGGTSGTIDLGSGTSQAFGVAMNAAGTEAFATESGIEGWGVVPITGPFTFTAEGAFNGTVGTPIISDGAYGEGFAPAGIVVSGDVVAVLNDYNPSYGVYLFNYTLSEGVGSTSEPDYVDLPYLPAAISANSAGLVAVTGQGVSSSAADVTYPDGADSSLCQTNVGDYAPGCVWTFSVASLTNEPTVTTAELDVGLGPTSVQCEDTCDASVYSGIQSIVISPENGDIYVTDEQNQGVWQVDSPYTTAAVVGFDWLRDVVAPGAIAINSAGTTLYIADQAGPHAYEVSLTDYKVPYMVDTQSANLTGTGETTGTGLLGIGLSPDGSGALVLDSHPSTFGDSTSDSLDDIATSSFTTGFTPYDPLTLAGGLTVSATSGAVVPASITVPTTGVGLPIWLAAILALAGVTALGASLLRRRALS